MKNNIENIAKWLKNYCYDSRFKGYVLGLSGGIDSSVSLGLAVKAVGTDNIKCFALPCSSDNEQKRTQDEDDAQLVADTFGVKLEKIFLDEEATKLYIDILPFNKNNSHLILPNIKARLRMLTIRALAESLGYLVLGTTNKTEEYLGYYTKAGDGGHGVDIEPIADFFKYEVRDMARELGVPEKIITKSPSAGLWFDQTDEDEIGFKYDDIDKYLIIREDWYNSDTRGINSKVFKKNVLNIEKSGDVKWMNLSSFMKKSMKVKSARIDEKLIDRIEEMIVSGNHKRFNPPSFTKNGRFIDLEDEE